MKTETRRGLEMFNRTGRKNDWCVVFPRRDFEEQRVRWGNRQEIEKDIDFYADNGHPPARLKGSWA
jgi:hypothetical protein